MISFRIPRRAALGDGGLAATMGSRGRLDHQLETTMTQAQDHERAGETVAGSVDELLRALDGIVAIDGDRVVVEDEAALRGAGIRTLAWTATFGGEESDQTAAARWIVWEAAQALGVRSASIHDLYMARGRGEVHGFTVPAINIRAQTFDLARTVFETARAHEVGAVILELARSEQTYTYQRVTEYATSVLAGAIAAGWRGPVFVQGDHYQFNAKKYAADPDAMTEEIRRACRQAIEAGYRNIDIDSSTLVDLTKGGVDEQQRANYMLTADMTALIRSLEHDGVTISVGGEIGEVGKENSTVEELRAYLAGYQDELERKAPGAAGISKVSVQTGTSHGGVVLPDGTIATVAVDFSVHEKLGAVAREHGLAGTVQHGASTLPDEAFHKFPAVETAEIHLATGFQNLLFDHPAFPSELHDEMRDWIFREAADERKSSQTDEQFVYTTRKKTIGPFKRRLWELPTKDEILADEARKIAFLFEQLRVVGSRAMVDRYVEPVEVHRPLPDALRASVGAGPGGR
jgi:fructose/tagatose bisphosphate aldolase